MNPDNYKKLPSVDSVLISEDFKKKYDNLEAGFLTYCVRTVLAEFRRKIKNNPEKFDKISRENILIKTVIKAHEKIGSLLDFSLKPVVNGTGVILHTGLGRAPIAPNVLDKIIKIAENYSNVEIDLDTGKRGDRLDHVEELLCYLSNAEAAAVVNNNAGAVLIALSSLAKGKEVIISRGQLIEIGGSFRLPDVMAQSGAVMKEIGTTNITRISDYQKAINKNTGAILVAHSSNYRILGFTREVAIADLIPLALNCKIPIIYDLGGGVFLDLVKFGLPYEPVVSEYVRLGVDVVTFSGDKVLGGPQSGILVGKKEKISLIRENPLMRALRCDKLIFSALEATLKLYLDPGKRLKELPVFRMLLEPVSEQRRRIEKILNLLEDKIASSVHLKIEDGNSEIGSGALPLAKIPSMVLRIESETQSAIKVSAFFRKGQIPIIGYLKDKGFYLNFRTILENELQVISEKLQNLF